MHEGEIKFNFKINFILCREQHACVLFEWKQICTRFLSFVYICIAVGDPVFKRAGLSSH